MVAKWSIAIQGGDRGKRRAPRTSVSPMNLSVAESWEAESWEAESWELRAESWEAESWELRAERNPIDLKA